MSHNYRRLYLTTLVLSILASLRLDISDRDCVQYVGDGATQAAFAAEWSLDGLCRDDTIHMEEIKCTFR